jgi:hypothetical protein
LSQPRKSVQAGLSERTYVKAHVRGLRGQGGSGSTRCQRSPAPPEFGGRCCAIGAWIISPESGKLRWHGIWTDQYGNLYRRTLVWHPGFWWFVLFAKELEGMRMQALKFYWKDRRSYIGGNKRA